MNEKIKSIDEVSGFKVDDGYEVVTDKQTIRVGIYNGQDCCENWGYVQSEDDLSGMVGADLIDIKLTDTALGNVVAPASEVYEGDVMFVDFITSAGTFQLACYNSHNGYYGHHAVVVSRQLNHETVL